MSIAMIGLDTANSMFQVDAYRIAGEVDYMLKVAMTDVEAFDGYYTRLSPPCRSRTSRPALP